MSLLPGNTPKRSRFRLVDVMPKGTLGGGHEPTAIGDGTDVPLKIYIPATGQTVDSFELLNPSESVLFALDPNGNVRQGGINNSVQFVAQVTLSAANIIAMYTTPVVIIGALASGLGIVVDQVMLQTKPGGTAFTGGGIVVFQYGTTAHGAGTLVHGGSIPASVIQSASGSLTLLSPTATSNGLTIPTGGTSASGLYISNATAVFAAGNGTAIATVYGSYVTLG
jgi:hypothetical protein